MALGLGVWVLLARMLPVEEFGEFSAALGVAIMFGTLANLGLAQYVAVPFRAAISTGEFATARGLRRFVPRCIALTALLAYGVVLTTHLAVGHQSAVRDESFAAVLTLLPMIAIEIYLVAAANLHGAQGRAMFISAPLLEILIGLGLLAAWMFMSDAFDLLDAALIRAIAMTIVCILLWRLMLSAEHVGFKSGPRLMRRRTWTIGTLPYFLSTASGIVLTQAPFLVLGWIHANGREAAMFRAADLLAQGLAIAGLAGGAMFLPMLADAINARDLRSTRRVVRRWCVLVGTLNLGGLAALGIFGEDLLAFFGPQYRDAYPLLLVIGTSIGGSMTASVFLSIVQYHGGGRQVIRTSLAWSGVGLLAMLVLGSRWEALGVAVGQAGAFLGMYLTFMIRARRFLRGTEHEATGA